MADSVIRGVPRALTRDMWWLTGPVEAGEPPAAGRGWSGENAAGRAGALVALVLLADWLFFGRDIGLSLAVFAAAVLGAVMATAPTRERLRPVAVLLVAALPVVEYVQALSLAFLALGLVVSVVWASGGAEALAGRALRLLGDFPLRGMKDGIGLGRDLAQSDVLGHSRRQMRAWAFPLGGALVLSALLIEANPVLGEIAFRLTRVEVGSELVERVLFWTGAALAVWPLIAPPRAALDLPDRLALPKGPGPGSVARGLWVFNAILGVQTLMDAAYLWGGAALPDGMTAAEYAHRGAYPLLATALLAGVFALAARPFAAEERQLRWLLMLWLAQNVALTLSALLRLELYVEAFGLTYLRLHAAIWMALVAAGLGLTAWQVWRGLPNRWLLIRSLGLGMGVLYACCFVNFAAIIAGQNLARPKFDASYVCDLGPMAAGAIAASGQRDLRRYDYYSDSRERCATAGPVIDGWRDWGFRAWRVNRYLERVAESVHEDPRRG